MKKVILLSLLPALMLLGAFSADENEGLKIGDTMPLGHTVVKDISGEDIMMRSMLEQNGLLVIFSCNTCPFVLAWEELYPELGEYAKENKIGMVLVNSNEAKRDGDDSFAEMKAHASEQGYNSYYVVDENSAIANAFGARTTPHVYLFNKDMKLAYTGAIDNKYETSDKVATDAYLQNAMEQMIAGNEISPAITTQKGCSIKRVKK